MDKIAETNSEIAANDATCSSVGLRTCGIVPIESEISAFHRDQNCFTPYLKANLVSLLIFPISIII